MKVALTIAGSDSGGGAGIQADLKTFEAHGLFGLSAITALTAQNTRKVSAVLPTPPDMLRLQLEALFDDFSISVIKIGMLPTGMIAELVVDFLDENAAGIPVVVDPVLVSTSGSRLATSDVVGIVMRRLLSRSTVITPNVREAEALTSRQLINPRDLRWAARAMEEGGGSSVVITGGDLGPAVAGREDLAVDLLRTGGREYRLSAPRLRSRSTHGTGCTFSSAIAANLACGLSIVDSVVRAKDYVHHAIVSAPGLGGGHGPLRHSFRDRSM